MARYTVQITFRVTGLRGPVEKVVHGLPGRGASVRLYGSEGMLAATGVVHEESPAGAAMAVAQQVGRHWSKADGRLRLVAWTAHRERVLARIGRGQSGSGRSLPGDDDGGPDDGGAGVREPRRPHPGPGSMSAALDLPSD